MAIYKKNTSRYNDTAKYGFQATTNSYFAISATYHEKPSKHTVCPRSLVHFYKESIQ